MKLFDLKNNWVNLFTFRFHSEIKKKLALLAALHSTYWAKNGQVWWQELSMGFQVKIQCGLRRHKKSRIKPRNTRIFSRLKKDRILFCFFRYQEHKQGSLRNKSSRKQDGVCVSIKMCSKPQIYTVFIFYLYIFCSLKSRNQARLKMRSTYKNRYSGVG